MVDLIFVSVLPNATKTVFVTGATKIMTLINRIMTKGLTLVNFRNNMYFSRYIELFAALGRKSYFYEYNLKVA